MSGTPEGNEKEPLENVATPMTPQEQALFFLAKWEVAQDEISRLQRQVNEFPEVVKMLGERDAEIARLKEELLKKIDPPKAASYGWEQIAFELRQKLLASEEERDHLKELNHAGDDFIRQYQRQVLSLETVNAKMREALESARMGLACMSEYIASKGLPFAMKDSVRESEKLVEEALNAVGTPEGHAR